MGYINYNHRVIEKTRQVMLLQNPSPRSGDNVRHFAPLERGRGEDSFALLALFLLGSRYLLHHHQIIPMNHLIAVTVA